MKEIVILDLCGVAGVLFQCIVYIISLQEKARTGNIQFDWWKNYVVRDKWNIILAFLSVAIWHAIYGEVAASYPWITALTRTSFVVFGALGSWGIQYALGGVRKVIIKIIDLKTDKLDEITNKETKTKIVE